MGYQVETFTNESPLQIRPVDDAIFSILVVSSKFDFNIHWLLDQIDIVTYRHRLRIDIAGANSNS